MIESEVPTRSFLRKLLKSTHKLRYRVTFPPVTVTSLKMTKRLLHFIHSFLLTQLFTKNNQHTVTQAKWNTHSRESTLKLVTVAGGHVVTMLIASTLRPGQRKHHNR